MLMPSSWFFSDTEHPTAHSDPQLDSCRQAAMQALQRVRHKADDGRLIGDGGQLILFSVFEVALFWPPSIYHVYHHANF